MDQIWYLPKIRLIHSNEKQDIYNMDVLQTYCHQKRTKYQKKKDIIYIIITVTVTSKIYKTILCG